MSDELMIQPQIIQPKKDNSAMYAAGAGIVGGGLGYVGANKLIPGKYTSFEDIAKDAKDSVDLSTKYSKADEATIQSVKDAAKEVKEAEAALENAKKPVLATGAPEQKAFDEAKKAYDEAFAKFKDEKLSTFKATTDGIDFKNPKFEKAKRLDNGVLAKEGEEISKWKPLQRYNAEKEYNRLIGNVESAAHDATQSLRMTGKPLNIIENETLRSGTATEPSIKDMFETFRSRYTAPGVTAKEKSEMFQQFYDAGGFDKETQAYKDAQNVAKRLFPESSEHLSTLSKDNIESYLKFGEIVEKKPYVKAGEHYDLIPAGFVKDGKRVTGYVHYTDDQLRDFNKTLKEEIVAKRKECAEQFLANAESYITAKEGNTPAKIAEDLAKGTFSDLAEARKLGATSAGAILDETGSDWIRHERVTCLTEADYKADIAKLKGAKRMPRGLKAEYYYVKADGSIAASTKPEKALEVAEARLQYVQEFNARHNELNKIADEALSSNPFIKEKKQKVQNAYSNNTRLQEALDKFHERFPKLYTGEAASLPADAEEKATKYAEGKTTDLKKAMEEKQGLLDKAKSEKGTANQEAINKATETLNNKKGELESRSKALAEKLGKTGGMNKWLGAGLGFAIAGLATYLATKPSND